jgi:hypothetical protein
VLGVGEVLVLEVGEALVLEVGEALVLGVGEVLILEEALEVVQWKRSYLRLVMKLGLKMAKRWD